MLDDDFCARSTLEIAGEQHTVQLDTETLKGTHTFDASQTSITIDADDTEGPLAGQRTPGIFKLEDDLFTICFAAPGQDRLTEYTTRDGKACILHRWKRAD